MRYAIYGYLTKWQMAQTQRDGTFRSGSLIVFEDLFLVFGTCMYLVLHEVYLH